MHKRGDGYVSGRHEGFRGAVIGFTSSSTAMLDLDGVTLRRAKEIADGLLDRFDLGGYVILQSSYRNYHVIFSRRLSWKRALQVMFSVPECRRRSNGKLSWAELQAIKGAATLRISNKGRKSPPREVYRKGKQNGEITRYWAIRRALGF
jgi:hypothetical protein